jgi:hypothetical protein
MLVLALVSTNAPKSMYIWWCLKGAFYGRCTAKEVPRSANSQQKRLFSELLFYISVSHLLQTSFLCGGRNREKEKEK